MGKQDVLVEHHCSQCLRKTKHRVRAAHAVKLDWEQPEPGEDKDREWWESYFDSHAEVWYSAEDDPEEIPEPFRTREHTYQILECCGCGAVSFRHHRVYENLYGAGGDLESIESSTAYPPAKTRREPSWITKCPERVQSLLQEVYLAYGAGARAVAAMGLRSIIDAVCTDKVGDCGGFQRKLEALVVGEFISSYQKDVLDAALDAGSAAAHRAHTPSAEELWTLIDIVENLLQATYDLRERAEKLRASTPKRRKPDSPRGDNGHADPR